MREKYRKVIFCFRRDLRLSDNSALIEACRSASQVLPVFVLDSRQLFDNPYRSDNCVQFMLESLADLDLQLASKGSGLRVLSGLAHEELEKLALREKAEAIFVNSDYTPFSNRRDQLIAAACERIGRKLHCYHDSLLNPPADINKKNGEPYTVFTPYFKCASRIEVNKPRSLLAGKLAKPIRGEGLARSSKEVLPSINERIAVKGGRAQALELLARLGELRPAARTRTEPILQGNTRLSAHNKFGTVSIREVHRSIVTALGAEHPLIRELYWRDFFSQIAFNFPRVFGNNFHPEYDRLRWRSAPRDLERWCSGMTGFPIVDAGMRELASTGFIHNRVRMIVASFLVKDLLIDWREGERHFARYLVDYDPAVNNGNWQWAASTGCDAQPYFRIFNPWLQQNKFDPDCRYIKTWLPELRSAEPAQIHDLPKCRISGYPKPMIDHRERAERAEGLFRKVKNS